MVKPSSALSKKASSSAITSAKKMLGDLPPSSRVTGIRFSDAYCMISRPVVVSPVKAILAMRLFWAREVPRDALPAHAERLMIMIGDGVVIDLRQRAFLGADAGREIAEMVDGQRNVGEGRLCGPRCP